MTDQHRADMMSCAGPSPVPTPRIDQIAADGVRFSNAFCPYPVCLASRGSLLTGFYPHHTGAINNTDRLDWRFRTLAHHFADAGYLTGLVGKMHFNDAHNHGFEYYLSINDWLMFLGPKVKHYAEEIANHPLAPQFFRTISDDGAGFPDMADLWGSISPWVGEVPVRDFTDMASRLDAEDHLDSFIARGAVGFMRRYQDQPFFLLVSFMKPHSPFYPPREWAEKYPVAEMELKPSGDISQYPPHVREKIVHRQNQSDLRQRAHRAGYRGNLAFVDTCVGQVCDALDELNLRDDTILVYTSDHGEMDGDHGLYQKFCLFDPAVRVPLIIRYPGAVPAGKVADALTEYIGLYPTLAELAGTPAPRATPLVPWQGAPGDLDVSSFARQALDPNLPGPEAVFAEFNLRGTPCQYMIRTARYKYILNEGAEDELYDEEADPGEFRNLAGDEARAGIQRELRERLIHWFDPSANPFRPKGKKATLRYGIDL